MVMGPVWMKLQRTWQTLTRQEECLTTARAAPAAALIPAPAEDTSSREVDFDPSDPLVAYFLHAPGMVEVDRLNLDSPMLRDLRAAGIKVAIPLISQGELIGLLNLGPRLSEQEYSSDDYRLLNNLSTQAAPALRMAQLARQQQAEARALERLEQELRVARFIQQTLLPKDLPAVAGWRVSAHWQPARAVSGDFYDFIPFPDGKIGIIVGDVTDKGVPAALVMASTRTLLRTVAERLVSPAQVLAQVNATLHPDIPKNMFVTCLYGVLDPVTGSFRFANAGHNLPFVIEPDGVTELRVTGMPLGLMEDSWYGEQEFALDRGAKLVLYSDGLVEAHNPGGDLIGFPRLKQYLEDLQPKTEIIPYLLHKMAEFTGPDWEQEDDVTLVTLEWMETNVNGPEESTLQSDGASSTEDWLTLAEFRIPSAPGNERQAMDQVAQVVKPLELGAEQLERVKTAVAEATMNAMEHGNRYNPDLPVQIKVQASPDALVIYITDQGGGSTIPKSEPPDLEAKLAGRQSPRGWGLFLIKNMVDTMNITTGENFHTMELIFKRPGARHD